MLVSIDAIQQIVAVENWGLPKTGNETGCFLWGFQY